MTLQGDKCELHVVQALSLDDERVSNRTVKVTNIAPDAVADKLGKIAQALRDICDGVHSKTTLHTVQLLTEDVM